MSIVINTNYPGQVSVKPRIIQVKTSDNLVTITSAGYLNGAIQNGFIIYDSDMIEVYGTDVVNSGPGSSLFQPVFNGSIVTLVEINNSASPFSIVLPTIANHIAVYGDASGQLTKDAATAINVGDIQAGLSGAAGFLKSFPATPAAGSFSMAAASNTGDFTTTLSNAAANQATTIRVPNVGAATSNFILDNTVSGSQSMASNLLIGIPHSLTVSNGTIQAGSSGTLGTFQTYPSANGTGSLLIRAFHNSGDYTVTLSNDSFGQSSTVSIVDPGFATGIIPVGATSNPFVSGNCPILSGTGGAIADSGIDPNYFLITSPGDSIQSLSNFIFKDVVINATALAMGAPVLIQAGSISKQYVVRDMYLNAVGGFAVGGDRNLIITDGLSAAFTVGGFSPAILVSPSNYLYGSTNNPMPSASAFSLSSRPGLPIICIYTGGTTDYASGSVTISFCLQRVA